MKRKVITIILIAAAILICVAGAILAILPILLQCYAVPRIEKALDADIQCEIRKFGIFSSEIGNIRIKKKTLIIDSDRIRLNYLFFGLAGVNSIDVSGLRIKLPQENLAENNLKKNKWDAKSISSEISSVNEQLKIAAKLIGKEMSFSADGIVIEKPFPAQLSIENGIIRIENDSVKCDLSFKIDGASNTVLVSEWPDGPLTGNISADLTNDGLELSGEQTGGKKGLVIKLNSGFASSLTFDKTKFAFLSKNALSGNAVITLSSVSAFFKDYSLNIPEAQINAEFPGGEKDGKKTRIFANFANASIKKGVVEILDIEGKIPIPFVPSGSGAEHGSLKTQKIIFNGKKIGGADLQIIPKKNGADAEGEFQIVDSDFKIPIKFSLRQTPFLYWNFEMLNEGTPEMCDIELGKFHDALKGWNFNGNLGLSVKLGYSNGEFKGNFRVKTNNGALSNRGKKISVTGIESEFESDDPFLRVSRPSQKIYAKSASVSNANFANLDISYRIEEGRKFFIENFSTGWCGGNIHIYSMRLDGSGKKSAVIYCDRLLLSEILSQLKICQATGEGRVNGRIPLTIADGNIFIDDGFLYSSPGAGGNIKVKDAETLFTGIPKDNPQFANINLTIEALKSFNYEWSKISISNEDENLLLKMELKGRPEKPLPFALNKKLNSVSHVELDSEGSFFREMKIDINCKFPLNTIMCYISGLKTFFNPTERK